MISESFFSPYSISSDEMIPSFEKAFSHYTRLGLDDAKKYFNSITDETELKNFLDNDYYTIRRMMTIRYGLQFIGAGSSRIVFRATDNTVLKVAFNVTGIMQNKAETHDANVKNRYGCFPMIFWRSRNNLAIECEMVDSLEDEDTFKSITGIDFAKFHDFLNYGQFIISNGDRKSNADYSDIHPSKMEDTYNEIAAELNNADTAAKKVLRNFAYYLSTHTSDREYIFHDLGGINNWGEATRENETVCIPLDTGGTNYVLDNYFTASGNPKV